MYPFQGLKNALLQADLDKIKEIFNVFDEQGRSKIIIQGSYWTLFGNFLTDLPWSREQEKSEVIVAWLLELPGFNQENIFLIYKNNHILRDLIMSRSLPIQSKLNLLRKLLNLKGPDGRLLIKYHHPQKMLSILASSLLFTDSSELVMLLLNAQDENGKRLFDVNEINHCGGYSALDVARRRRSDDPQLIQAIIDAGGLSSDEIIPTSFPAFLYYQSSQETISSSLQPNGPPDIDYLVQSGQLLWRGINEEGTGCDLPKIIAIHDWSLAKSSKKDQIVFQRLLTALQKNGFTLYLWQGNDIEQLTTAPVTDEKLAKISPISTHDLKTHCLRYHGIAEKELHLLDYFSLSFLLSGIIDHPSYKHQRENIKQYSCEYLIRTGKKIIHFDDIEQSDFDKDELLATLPSDPKAIAQIIISNPRYDRSLLQKLINKYPDAFIRYSSDPEDTEETEETRETQEKEKIDSRKQMHSSLSSNLNQTNLNSWSFFNSITSLFRNNNRKCQRWCETLRKKSNSV